MTLSYQLNGIDGAGKTKSRILFLHFILLIFFSFLFSISIYLFPNRLLENIRSTEYELGYSDGLLSLQQELKELGFGEFYVEDLSINFRFFEKDVHGISGIRGINEREEIELENFNIISRSFGGIGEIGRIERDFNLDNSERFFMNRDRLHYFSIEDFIYFKRYDLNLEDILIGLARVSIQHTLYEYLNNHDGEINWFILENLLKENVQESLHKGFDGFETYFKVNRRRR